MAKRNETSKDVVKVNPMMNMMAKIAKEDKSLDSMNEYRVLPRFKLLQGMTAEDLKDKFGEGSAIVRPGDTLVTSKEGSFDFVPLMFFGEFTKMADRRDKENPMIMARSFDPSSDLAKKARSKELRWELYPGERPDADKPKKFRYVEHLRFPGLIYGGHDLRGVAAVLSFEKGEYYQGQNLIQAIKLRREKFIDEETGEAKPFQVPLYCQVWTLSPGQRTRDDKKWWGFNFKAAENPNVDETDIDSFRLQHQELVDLHAKQRIVVDGDDSEEEQDSAANSSKY